MPVIVKSEVSSPLQESCTHKRQVRADSPVTHIRVALLSML